MKMFNSFTPEETEERRKYINASEVYDIMVGDWFNLWEEKIGDRTRDLSDIFQVQLGTYTETFNLYWTLRTHPEFFDDDTRQWAEGLLKQEHSQASYICKEHDFLRATPDCICVVDGRKAVMDFKHTYSGSYKSGETEEERVIERYQWQIHQQMLCTGYDRGVIVPIYGNKYGPPIILHRNEEMINLIIDKCKKFWEHVTLRVEPEDLVPVQAPSITHNNMRVINEIELKAMNIHKDFVDLANTYTKYIGADKKIKEVKNSFKELIPDDVKEITAYGLLIKRNRKGAVSFYVTET